MIQGDLYMIQGDLYMVQGVLYMIQVVKKNGKKSLGLLVVSEQFFSFI